MKPPSVQEFANLALQEYSLPPGAEPRLVSLSENATFLVETGSPIAVLRLYRPNYQSELAMKSELAWLDSVRESGIKTPECIRTTGGCVLGTVEIDGYSRHFALFEYIDGEPPGVNDPTVFSVIGGLAAQLHDQVIAWVRPEPFERPTWDLESILGPNALWGDWRNGPGLSTEDKVILEEAESKVREKLTEYPQTPTNSGLVHCDLRDANLVRRADGSVWIIDFDDSGFSWFLWDLCSCTTLIEHEPQVTDIIDAWVEGYSQIREISPKDTAAIVDLVFLRRLHLMAWLGSHSESDLAKDVGGTFPGQTVQLAQQYLAGDFLKSSRVVQAQ